ALADLRRLDDAEARRSAVRALGDTGVMADLPAMVQALRDSDATVRALAETAMWEVWSRSGDAEIDALFAIGAEQMGQRQLDEALAVNPNLTSVRQAIETLRALLLQRRRDMI